LGIEGEFPPKAGNQVHFHLLNKWLQDCNENYASHGPASCGESELPTRVLDVGDSKCPNKLQLFITKGAKGRYIAVSHRWGDAMPFRTSKGNIDNLCEAIRFDDLPKTFQDTVVVTRQLSVRFLWIDSLCIIQGEDAGAHADWKYESERMGNVFASAYCTIAVTSAKNCTEGFLRPRPLTAHGGKVGENFDLDVEKGELNQRAWVYQERALSPRIIHFTTAQTYWECGTVIRCESLLQIFR
jgi:Heterokaryon incompatibility protein (HET)